MREALFIKKNAQKWQEYEHFETDDPDEMANRFTTLVDDLAYAKTFYPHSKVTRLINGLAVSIYQSIYQNKKEKYSRLISFWKTELPMVIRKNHKTFLFTFIVFAVCCAMGIISSMRDYEFVKGVLGEDYVAMTEDNIANGDPFGVYKNTGEGGYFSTFMWFFGCICCDHYCRFKSKPAARGHGAGTVVVDTRIKTYLHETVFLDISHKDYNVQFPEVMKLTDRDINTIKSILDVAARKGDFQLAANAADKIKNHLKIQSAMSPFDFLEKVLMDYNYISTK